MCRKWYLSARAWVLHCVYSIVATFYGAASRAANRYAQQPGAVDVFAPKDKAEHIKACQAIAACDGCQNNPLIRCVTQYRAVAQEGYLYCHGRQGCSEWKCERSRFSAINWLLDNNIPLSDGEVSP